MTYNFPENLEIPMYEYLYQCIKEDILNETLKAGEKLPSKRIFAKQQNVSLVTIEACYNQLIMEGYIYALEKKGYFVCNIQKDLKADSTEPVKKTVTVKKQFVVDLASNTILEDGFPFDSIAKITRKVLNDNKNAFMVRSESNGLYSLRKAISDHLASFKGFRVEPEQIVIGAGSDVLYNLITQLFGPDHHYAIENPGYKTIGNVYRATKNEYTSIPMDEKGIDISALNASEADIVHVSCTHHFPTGITMPADRRLELIEWANSKNGYIIEDDYDSEFRMRVKAIAPLYSLDNQQRVIYLNTFTKTLSPAFRIAYMVLPKALLETYKSRVGFYSCSVSVLDQLILAEFISSGQFERHIHRLRNRYQQIRTDLLKGISVCDYYHNITIEEDNAGLHFLIKYDPSVFPYTEEEMVEKAASHGLKITGISQYYEEPKDTHTLMINYSGLSEASVNKAIICLAVLFKKEQPKYVNPFSKPQF